MTYLGPCRLKFLWRWLPLFSAAWNSVFSRSAVLNRLHLVADLTADALKEKPLGPKRRTRTGRSASAVRAAGYGAARNVREPRLAALVASRQDRHQPPLGWVLRPWTAASRDVVGSNVEAEAPDISIVSSSSRRHLATSGTPNAASERSQGCLLFAPQRSYGTRPGLFRPVPPGVPCWPLPLGWPKCGARCRLIGQIYG